MPTPTKPQQKKTARDTATGRYAHSRMDRMCVCGHVLGAHTAARVGGVQTCLHDNEGCGCQSFRRSRAKREWHGCSDPRGHTIDEGVCHCGMDLRISSEASR